jgi:hypothetical protein
MRTRIGLCAISHEFLLPSILPAGMHLQDFSHASYRPQRNVSLYEGRSSFHKSATVFL